MPRYSEVFRNLHRISDILQHSITKRLLVVVFSIYLILTITVTVVQMNFEYESAKKQTILAMQNIQQMTEDSLAQAIWEYNVSQIDSVLKGIYTSKFIVGEVLDIEDNAEIPELNDYQMGLINDAQGNILNVDSETKQSVKQTSSLERLIPYQYHIYHLDANNNKQKIGSMILYSSNKVVFDQVKDNFIILIVNAMIKTLALWVFFLWAGYEFISKPLQQLTNAIKKLAAGNWNTEVVSKYNAAENKTEINTLIDSFNTMTHKLYTAQINLENSANKIKNIFNTMPSALIFIDDQYIIQGWNKYIVQETGIAEDSALSKPLLEIYAAFTDYVYLIKDALRTNKEQQIKNARLILRQGDERRLFNIVVYPIITSSAPECVIRIDDITEQVKTEAGLAQVEKLASVGALIAGVAHEINNPLGSVMQGTQNVIRRLDPKLQANIDAAAELGIDLNKQQIYLEKREIFSFLDNIRIAGERASSIVKNMLSFTRRSTAEMSKHNIVTLINDGLQLAATDFNLQEKVDFKKIAIIKNISENEIFVECYPIEIQQVILNILKNAAQALDLTTHEKKIIIDLTKTDPNHVRLTIEDTGPGIPDDVKDQIFKPFFTTKPVGEGTGLGLSVCRNIIVQKHRGTMDVESTVGVGTKFIITLPINQGA